MKKKSGFLALSIIVLLILPVAVSADSPGVIAGYSNRDQQTMGGTNNRCAVDALSGGHVSWTEGGLSDRIVNYNFIDENGDPAFDDGTQVNPIYGGGFPSVVVNSQNAAGVAYHNFSNLNVTLGVDGARGIGLFTIYDPPDGMPGISYTFWPQMAIDY
ncbi:MAG: hypothetical protein GY855_12650, partial [candidate division Zixibacteria bacterium]|nr:hypothetical protein [candidate division Zixibacteria bacterium]